ncbi:hypothetical protein FUAX_32220 [Fulvitalea axinellae]|uniref:Uncharacterized protein n=1 Tax=Fulvitalea axinellae TaxID=1182444 RepID=A0AAU9CN29_9BACT|nr:hypothetical protein FUAX_32220 [Fulvitalea axinellae]
MQGFIYKSNVRKRDAILKGLAKKKKKKRAGANAEADIDDKRPEAEVQKEWIEMMENGQMDDPLTSEENEDEAREEEPTELTSPQELADLAPKKKDEEKETSPKTDEAKPTEKDPEEDEELSDPDKLPKLKEREQPTQSSDSAPRRMGKAEFDYWLLVQTKAVEYKERMEAVMENGGTDIFSPTFGVSERYRQRVDRTKEDLHNDIMRQLRAEFPQSVDEENYPYLDWEFRRGLAVSLEGRLAASPNSEKVFRLYFS